MRRRRDPDRSVPRSGSSSPRSRRLHPAPPPQRAVLASTRLLFMTRFARCATTHKPWPMAVPGLLFTQKIGGAPSHHQRQLIPRKIPPPSQVLVRAAACTLRDATTHDRHSAVRRELRRPHLRLSNLRGPCLSEPHDRCVRGRVADACLPVLLHRVLLLLQIDIIQRAYVAM